MVNIWLISSEVVAQLCGTARLCHVFFATVFEIQKWLFSFTDSSITALEFVSTEMMTLLRFSHLMTSFFFCHCSHYLIKSGISHIKMYGLKIVLQQQNVSSCSRWPIHLFSYCKCRDWSNPTGNFLLGDPEDKSSERSLSKDGVAPSEAAV